MPIFNLIGKIFYLPLGACVLECGRPLPLFQEHYHDAYLERLQTDVDVEIYRRMIGVIGIMKTISILTAVMGVVFAAFSDPVDPFEIGSPHFSTNTDIIWQAPTGQLPQSFWTYRRILPRIFAQTVISNAIVLASLQQKGFPKPSTNNYYVSEFNPPPDYPDVIPVNFEIIPGDALLSYEAPNDADNRPDKDIPNNEEVIAYAGREAPRLGLDPAELIQKSFYNDFNVDYQNENPITNGIQGRGVFFSRQLDKLMFFSADDQGDGAEGFFFELGSYGKIRAFSIHWSDVGRYQRQPIATPQEIIRCIRARKIIVLPDNDDDTYFAKIKQMSTAKRFVISKITPYYTDSIFGEVTADNIPCKFITPVAKLDAIADFGNSNMTVHLYSPITSSDVNRLLGK